jgi:glycosyltransferase involved in cell wall biosynthesis
MSKNIFIFAGYAPSAYNGKNYQTAEGCRGSEISLVNLAENLAKNNTVTVGYAPIIEGHHNGVNYIPWEKIQNFLFSNKIDVLIISRYLNFFVEFINTAEKTYLWLHDYHALPWLNGTTLPHTGRALLLNQWNNINGIVALSRWHANNVKDFYGLTSDGPFSFKKINIIGNAINADRFEPFDIDQKVNNRFIFTSANGGLDEAIEVFKKYHSIESNAELHIFHSIEKVKEEHKNVPGVILRGIVPNDQLIQELLKAEFWIYPAEVNETYCISALEARAAGCIPLAKPMGGMSDVLKDYFIHLDDPLLLDKLGDKEILKDMILKSRQDALNETWLKRAHEWEELIG